MNRYKAENRQSPSFCFHHKKHSHSKTVHHKMITRYHPANTKLKLRAQWDPVSGDASCFLL